MNEIIRFFCEQDSTWSLCTLPFMMAFIVFFAIYLLLQRSSRTAMMAYVVAFSLFFAYKANGILMVLLPLTALLSWWLTRLMSNAGTKAQQKFLLTLTILIDLAPLCYYKYTNFSISTVNAIFGSNFALQDIFLPVGISFYTFQAISYSIDVYKKKFTLDTSLLEYFFYITFFPLLMAGPITRAETLIPQLKQERKITDVMVYGGLWLIIIGLLKKGLISDYIAQYNNWIFDDPMGYSGFENMMGILGFTLQIYCDFSGYSDMSIGIAAVMGFQLKENFNSPYQSLNVGEFWHRWHIALSTWFRDYVYIPLGGNRKGKLRTYFNNFVTMLVSGLWHGASWMFVFWGALHGIALVINKLCKGWLDRLPNTWYVRFAAWLITFVFINFSWVFFRAHDMQTAWQIINHSIADFSWDYLPPFVFARPIWMLFVMLGFVLHSIRKTDADWLCQRFINSHWLVKLAVFVIAIQLVVTFRSDTPQPFIYAQF
ncbi:MAG: MBOAT family protein [Prevotella sp.]|nr:MBOAT family protein [Prevotella sp.]MCR5153184.1 MBOAT family protein [Prevotella sp.]